MATKHEDQCAKMAEEVDTDFWMVFSERGLTDLVKPIPWCLSTTANPGTVSIHYMSEALTIAVQGRMGAQLTATTHNFEGSQAPASMSSLAHSARTPLLPVLPMSDIPLIGTPQLGVHLFTSWLIPSS